MNYQVVDIDLGQSASELTDLLNSYGTSGWCMTSTDLISQTKRRAIFMATGTVEYLVVDYAVGKSPSLLQDDLDLYGVDGWQLLQVDMIQHSNRRAIFGRGPGLGGGGGGNTGGISEAPADGKTYGRMNETWNQVIAHSNDVVDGGSF